MMTKEAVIKFFDKCSAKWDENMLCDDDKMNEILDCAKIESGKAVLDIACGTGIMFSFYLERGVERITGVDISPKMAEICAEKFSDNKKISVLCADAESYEFEKCYDSCMVFNAFPHFVNPEKLILNLCSALRDGGTLTIAHDRGRKALDIHHSGEASAVSNGLMSENDLAEIFTRAGFKDIYTKATDEIYIVTGKK